MAQIAEAMRANGLNPGGLIYNTPTVSVYSGTYNQWPVVYKVLSISQGQNYQVLEQECRTLQALTYPNIVKLYHFGWIQAENNHFLVMVLERCEKDLGMDCKQRLSNSFAYQEADLWGMTRDLVRTLAWLQQQNIAHRDIKPENIFLTQTTIKLGDFGSSRYIMADIRQSTTTGTPIYLSPKLKEGLYSGSSQVAHNAYKSDVYSLGITLLVLAILNPVNVINPTPEKLMNILAGIPYSEQYKQMVSWMLTQREEDRPDFIQLQQWLEPTQVVADQSAISPQQPYASYSNPDTAPTSPDSDQVKGTSSQRRDNPPSQPAQYQVESRPANYQQPQAKADSSSTLRASQQKSAVSSYKQSPSTAQPVEEEKFVHSRPPRNRQSAAPSYQADRETSAQSFAEHRSVLPGSQPLNCAQCHKAMFRTDLPAETVQLPCDPFTHICCSLHCFQALLRTSTRVCPVCKAPIDQETIAFYECPEGTRSKCKECMKAMAVFFVAIFVLIYHLLSRAYFGIRQRIRFS